MIPNNIGVRNRGYHSFSGLDRYWSRMEKTVGGFRLFSLVVKVLADLLQLLIFGEEFNLVMGYKILLTWLEYFISYRWDGS